MKEGMSHSKDILCSDRRKDEDIKFSIVKWIEDSSVYVRDCPNVSISYVREAVAGRTYDMFSGCIVLEGNSGQIFSFARSENWFLWKCSEWGSDESHVCKYVFRLVFIATNCEEILWKIGHKRTRTATATRWDEPRRFSLLCWRCIPRNIIFFFNLFFIVQQAAQKCINALDNFFFIRCEFADSELLFGATMWRKSRVS